METYARNTGTNIVAVLDGPARDGQVEGLKLKGGAANLSAVDDKVGREDARVGRRPGDLISVALARSDLGSGDHLALLLDGRVSGSACRASDREADREALANSDALRFGR